LFKIGLHVLGLKIGHFWKEIGQKLTQSCSKLASFFCLEKMAVFSLANWPKIDPKVVENSPPCFFALKMAISLNKLAPFIQNWPKNDPKWFKFCLKKISSFQGINWPKIDPENFKIRRRSDSTFGLAQLAHNMAKTG
jgi:hypothetical protein